MKFAKKIGCAALLLGSMQSAMAARPMITDDTGTQGTGNQQVEFNLDRTKQRDNQRQHNGNLTYAYGLNDSLDVFAEQPFTVTKPRGLNDSTLGLKWRFFQRDTTSVGLKSSVSMGNANEDKGFGTGRSNLTTTLIASFESGPWGLHYNLGLATNRYKLEEARNSNRNLLWKTSAAATYAVLPQLKLAADVGIERNPEVGNSLKPAYALTGLIYSPHKQVDLDLGVKFGLNPAEIKHQLAAGVTLRF